MSYAISLNNLYRHWYGRESWRTLLRSLGLDRAGDERVSVEHIYGLFGFTKALWSLRALPEDPGRRVRSLVCNLVQPALHLNDDQRVQDAFQVARAYVRYEVDDNKLSDAYEAAWETLSPKAREYIHITIPEVVTFAVLNATSEDVTEIAATASNTALHAIQKAEGDAAAMAARVEQEQVFRRWLQRG